MTSKLELSHSDFAAILARGIHPTEVAWLADFIEALGNYEARAGD